MVKQRNQLNQLQNDQSSNRSNQLINQLIAESVQKLTYESVNQI